ncbi:MAG TPA: Gfo/Idh/MocA family oxidoreductase [Phycisphaerae bacterium]|nr:Gfo/Idh/MocA family oxidoreductase [Phycisphaerae bacterium]
MSRHPVALVGCGAFARSFLLPNIVANPRLELAVTCDIDAQAADQCRQQFGARRACSDWQEIVADPDIRLIVMATHTNLRGRLILPALKAGKAVYVEKPLANTQEEMLEIVRAVRSTGVPVCVGHNKRSSPAILDLKKLIEKARGGEGGWRPSVDRTQGRRQRIPEESQMQILMRVNDDCRSWVDWIFWDPEGILFAEMVHFVDLALWFNPAPPVRVFAEGSARGNFALVIKFQDGSLTTMQQTLCGHFDSPKELYEVSLNHVTLNVDHYVELRQRGLADEPFRRTYAFKHEGNNKEMGGIEAFHRAVTEGYEKARSTGGPPPFIMPDKGHADHLDRFVDCIESKGPNPCEVTDAVIVTRVTLKLLQSIRLGLPLNLGPEDYHIPAS